MRFSLLFNPFAASARMSICQERPAFQMAENALLRYRCRSNSTAEYFLDGPFARQKCRSKLQRRSAFASLLQNFMWLSWSDPPPGPRPRYEARASRASKSSSLRSAYGLDDCLETLPDPAAHPLER
jgi:hypothetical protein